MLPTTITHFCRKPTVPPLELGLEELQPSAPPQPPRRSLKQELPHGTTSVGVTTLHGHSPPLGVTQGGWLGLGDLQQHPEGVQLVVGGLHLGHLDQRDAQ